MCNDYTVCGDVAAMWGYIWDLISSSKTFSWKGEDIGEGNKNVKVIPHYKFITPPSSLVACRDLPIGADKRASGQICGGNGGGQVRDRTTPWPFSSDFCGTSRDWHLLESSVSFLPQALSVFPSSHYFFCSIAVSHSFSVLFFSGRDVLFSFVFIWPTLKLVDLMEELMIILESGIWTWM